MKIRGTGQTQGPSKTKGKTGASENSADFGAFISSGTPDATPTQAPQNIAQVDALLAIQGAEDPTAGAARKRMRRRSTNLLDGLERIRMAMLAGGMTVGDMVNIADVVASHRERVSDPALTALMDEIDLRAQVELAKMRMALDAQEPA